MFRDMAHVTNGPRSAIRVGLAAEMLQVSIETLRRWETEGRLRMDRSSGGQRMVPIGEITRLLAERRALSSDRSVPAGSARNRFPGIITRIEKDMVAVRVSRDHRPAIVDRIRARRSRMSSFLREFPTA